MAEEPSAPRWVERLRNAPWWVVALLMGLPPGIAVGTFWGVVQGDAVLGLVTGLLWLLVGARSRTGWSGAPESVADRRG